MHSLLSSSLRGVRGGAGRGSIAAFVALVAGLPACSSDKSKGSPSMDSGLGRGDSGTKSDTGGSFVDSPARNGDAGGDAGPRFDVTTASGVVRGKVDSKTRAFLAIPYAAPPTGANRFRAPQPVSPWTTPRDAATPSKVCPQIAAGGTATDARSDEDCLTLNVWMPDPPSASPLPVMVWFHGGAFVFGSGAETYYDGAKLVEAGNVVIVTVNYRLGALGFLALPALTAESTDHPTSGNYGFEDQQAALTWVKNNIGAFGGDSGQVTIFGESAGGYSVCAHLVAPGSKGLFQRAISESGLCSGLTGSTRDAAYSNGEVLSRAVGCTDASKVLACLRGKTPDEFVHAFDGAAPELPGGTFLQGSVAALTGDAGTDAGAPQSGLTWSPVVDGTTIAVNIADVGASFAKVPLLLGTNANEGTLFTAPGLFGGVPVTDDTEYQAAVARTFGNRSTAVLAQYPSSGFASANDAVNELVTDAFFVCPARRLARDAAAAGVSVYLYAFAHVPEKPLLPGLGSFHASEFPYVFGIDSPLATTQPDEQPLIPAMQGYWTRFAHTGDPNGTGAPAWPKYAAASDQDLKLETPAPTEETGHKKAKCDFWDGLH